MIPFKSLLRNLSQREADAEIPEQQQREKEISDFRRFSLTHHDVHGSCSSSRSDVGTWRVKRPLGRHHDDEPFWSRKRFRGSVRLQCGLWQEVSGSLGDLGSFLPAALALSLVNGLDFGSTFILTGISSLCVGFVFGVPLPVQPMSAIVMAALARTPLTTSQIMAGGISTGLVVGFLGITGAMEVIHRLIPASIVRGVMLGEGLIAGLKGLSYILENHNPRTLQPEGLRAWMGTRGLLLPMALMGLLSVILQVGTSDEAGIRGWTRGYDDRMERESLLSRGSTSTLGSYENLFIGDGKWGRAVLGLPAGVFVIFIAMCIALFRDPRTIANLQLGPSPLKLVTISWEDWSVGFLQAAVYQIPVTILSSIVCLSKLSSDYFPGREVTPSAACLSVSMINVLGCWFGMVPVCHGVVGLAGQHTFGARSGLSMVMLGTSKVLLGLVLGPSLFTIFSQVPSSLLGILLVYSGLELAVVCHETASISDAMVMLAIPIVSIGMSSQSYHILAGFLVGLVLHFGAELHAWLQS